MTTEELAAYAAMDRRLQKLGAAFGLASMLLFLLFAAGVFAAWFLDLKPWV